MRAFEKSSPLDAVALSTECVVPSLVQARKSVEQMLIESEGIKESKPIVCFIFVIIAFVPGGKVAGSSTKLTGHDALDLQERRRVAKLFLRGFRGIKGILRSLVRRIAAVFRYTVQRCLLWSRRWLRPE